MGRVRSFRMMQHAIHIISIIYRCPHACVPVYARKFLARLHLKRWEEMNHALVFCCFCMVSA